MDFGDLQNAMKFFNWEMITAIGILVTAFTQLLKQYVPAEITAGKAKIPLLPILAFASGLVFAHIIFDIAGVNHTEEIALFHGFAGTLFALLGYELLKGTKLGLRSADEMKSPPSAQPPENTGK
jgi:hypothetical protein